MIMWTGRALLTPETAEEAEQYATQVAPARVEPAGILPAKGETQTAL